MTRTLLFAIAACTLPAMPLHALAATPGASERNQQAVLAPIDALFRGMTARDGAAIQKPLLAGGSMVLMRDGKAEQLTFPAFAELVSKPSPHRIEERIHDPLIRIDNDLAVVWAPFEFLLDGKVDHCGTDLFSLIRQEGEWRIASIADTGTKQCATR